MNRYEIKFERNGTEHRFVRLAESATEAADKLCDQYGWEWKYGLIDADTRGIEWAELPVAFDGFDSAIYDEFSRLYIDRLHESAADKIAQQIRDSAEWDSDLLAALCKLAGMEAEWAAADGESFERVAEAAADKLGVNIY